MVGKFVKKIKIKDEYIKKKIEEQYHPSISNIFLIQYHEVNLSRINLLLDFISFKKKKTWKYPEVCTSLTPYNPPLFFFLFLWGLQHDILTRLFSNIIRN